MKKSYPYLPFILATIILLLLLSSCNVTKHQTKTETKEHVAIDTQISGTKTTTEDVDSCKEVPASTTNVQSPIEPLLKGDSTVNETPDETIINKVVNGKLNTKVITKPKSIPFKVHKKTVEVFRGEQKVQGIKTTEVSTKDVKRTGHSLWWLSIPICGLLAWALWYFGLLRKKKGGNEPPA